MAKVTLQSIADRVGVSRMTVSNAFSRPDQLSAGLRERILAAADELGYVGPDPAARALARGRTGSIGLLLKGSLSQAFEDAVSAEFLAAVSDEATRQGQALTLLTAGDEGDFVPARDVAVDGALIYVCAPDSPDATRLRQRGIPLVAVDRFADPGVATVNVADRDGARLAAEHVVGLGHRSIGIVTLQEKGHAGRPLTDATTMSTDFPASERMRGWRDVLEPAGIEPQVVVSQHGWSMSAYDAARALLERPEPPTAILCYSDAFAIGVIRAAESLGLRVPQDVSVVGFDDSPLAATTRPPLTTVRQDVAGKGRTAVQTLLQVMAGAEPGPVVVPTTLVVRESTAPPRA